MKSILEIPNSSSIFGFSTAQALINKHKESVNADIINPPDIETQISRTEKILNGVTMIPPKNRTTS